MVTTRTPATRTPTVLASDNNTDNTTTTKQHSSKFICVYTQTAKLAAKQTNNGQRTNNNVQCSSFDFMINCNFYCAKPRLKGLIICMAHVILQQHQQQRIVMLLCASIHYRLQQSMQQRNRRAKNECELRMTMTMTRFAISLILRMIGCETIECTAVKQQRIEEEMCSHFVPLEARTNLSNQQTSGQTNDVIFIPRTKLSPQLISFPQ